MFLWQAPAFADEIPIAIDPYSQTAPIVVHDGEKFFVAYSDRAGGAYTYQGKFVSHDGTVSTATTIVPTYSWMSLMHDMTLGDNQFLFVYSRQRGQFDYQRDGYATLVNAGGSQQGNILRISEHNTLAANFLKAAFDGEKYLAVWQEGAPTQASRIKGQFISTEGTLMNANFEIRPSGLDAANSQIYPDIVFDGTNYLVVWDDNRSGNRRIYGWFISPQGDPVGEDFMIGEAGPDQLLVQVAYNGQHFMAVWADRRDGNKNGVYGQLIDRSGNLIGGNIAISPLANNQERTWPRVGTNGNQFLVAWNHQTFSKDGASLSPEREIMLQQAGLDASKSTIWWEVHGRLLNGDGTFAADEVPIGATVGHQQDPSIDGFGDRILTAWQDSRMNNQYNNIYGLITPAQAPLLLPEPQDLVFDLVDETVVLLWNPPAGKDLMHYRVYRDGELLADEVDDTTFTDDTVEQETTYSYYVTAMYDDGESDPSNQVEVTTPTWYVTLTFMVWEATPGKDNGDVPVEGAKVTLETSGEAYTDADGVAVFNDVAVAESLDYEVEKEGFFTVQGTLDDVHQSMEINIHLEIDDTGIAEPEGMQLHIFPNPARGWLKVQSEMQMRGISLSDLTGKVVLHHANQATTSAGIETAHLPQGVYLLSIVFENGYRKTIRVMVR
jgi:hypothetical protein